MDKDLIEHFAEKIEDLYGHGTFSVSMGKRWAKIIHEHGNGQKSVHAFVDPQTLDVYMAASWAAPAKHIRGNLTKWVETGDLSDAGVDSSGFIKYLR